LGATSLVLIAYTLYIIIWPLRWRLLLVWPVVEALFFVCVFLPRYDRLNKQPQPHEPAGHDAMRCWRRFMRYVHEVPGGMDTGAYLSGWYRGADPSQIKRGAAATRIRPRVFVGACGLVSSSSSTSSSSTRTNNTRTSTAAGSFLRATCCMQP
jgi:hypothetical protein